MNVLLIYGILSGAAAVLVGVLVLGRLLRMKGYERAVRAYLGKDAESAYDELTMIRFYDQDMRAADAAREMVSARRSAKGLI